MHPELHATALIAEDEPLLAQALQAELRQAWPGLQVLAVAGNGHEAVEQTLALRPQVLFFDIRMPGLSGLEAAAALLDEWPEGQPFPALVFVTAYDQYAVTAFEAQAVDYVLKPVEPARLQKTLVRVQGVLAAQTPSLARMVDQMRALLGVGNGLPRPDGSGAALPAAPAAAPPLRHIQAGVGSAIRLIPVDDVIYFEAADKYVRVITAGHEDLIRTPLRELIPRLDPALFWQVHRGTVVRVSAIEQVLRDDSGRLSLVLRGCPDRLGVSRLYAHLFKAM